MQTNEETELPFLDYEGEYRIEDLAKFRTPVDVVVFRYTGIRSYDAPGCHFIRWDENDVDPSTFPDGTELLFLLTVRDVALFEPVEHVTRYRPVGEE